MEEYDIFELVNAASKNRIREGDVVRVDVKGNRLHAVYDSLINMNKKITRKKKKTRIN
jgi:hypothetical protein